MGNTFAERMAGTADEDENQNTSSVNTAVPTTESSGGFASSMAKAVNNHLLLIQNL